MLRRMAASDPVALPGVFGQCCVVGRALLSGACDQAPVRRRVRVQTSDGSSGRGDVGVPEAEVFESAFREMS